MNMAHRAPATNDSGVALILVMFIIALGSLLAVNLAYSVHLGSRLSVAAERTVQAEYILKSALNFARVLIKEDKTRSEDSLKDPWGYFLNGALIPEELLALPGNPKVSLEIRPEDSKIPLRSLDGSTKSAAVLRAALERLYTKFGFDDDRDEIDQTGIFGERHFPPKELVAILIDYVDADKKSFSDPDFLSSFEGEESLPENLFPNQPITRIGELASVPGYTPKRLQRIIPFVTACSACFYININTASKEVLETLSVDFGDVAAQMVAFREGDTGPFTQIGKESQLVPAIMDDSVYRDISMVFSVYSNAFSIIAKVDYGASIHFLRAVVKRAQQDELPQVESIEIY